MLSGFIYTYSDPDQRFEESMTMAYDDPDGMSLLGTAVDTTAAKYQFLVFSDIQGQTTDLLQLKEVLDEYRDSPTNDINNDGLFDLFLFDLGDSSEHGYLEEYTTYKNMMDATGVPWFQTLGNHDLYNDGWKQYRQVLGKTVFTFEVGTKGETGSMFLISLDTANSSLGMLQMDWLEETLKRESGLWDHIIVLTHSQFFADPILTVVQFTDTEEIYKLTYLFKTYGVDIFFAGHTHVWNYRTLNDVEYVTIPPLEKAFSEDAIVRVTVDGSNLSWEKIIIPDN